MTNKEFVDWRPPLSKLDLELIAGSLVDPGWVFCCKYHAWDGSFRETHLEKGNLYYQEHRESVLRQKKEYYIKNREKRLQYQKEYYFLKKSGSVLTPHKKRILELKKNNRTKNR